MEGLVKHNNSGWIKMYRSMLNWRWYSDVNTTRVWMHLLLKANIRPHGFEGITVNRGQLATSYRSLAAQTNLTFEQVRTAIRHLRSTGEVTVLRRSNFLVISIVNFDSYQCNDTDLDTDKTHSLHRPSTFTSHQSKNIKNEKEVKASFDAEKPEREWEKELNVPAQFLGRFPDAESYLAFADRWA